MKITKRLIVLSLPLFLVACAGSGPSKSQAEESINELLQPMQQMQQFLSGNNQSAELPKVKVADIKCEKKGDSIFNCQVLAEIQGQEVQDSYQFTWLDGKWRARAVR